jgi:HEAT repeat protein
MAIARDQKDQPNQAHALLALGFLGADPKVVVPVLLEGLRDERGQYNRIMSAQGLGGLGPQAKEALPDLNAALKDPDALVRVHAAGAIWKIEKRAEAVVPALTDALTGGEDRNASAGRVPAVHYLGQIGSEAKAALPALLKLWQDFSKESKGSRKYVADALIAIDAEAAAKAGVTATDKQQDK